MKKNKLILGLMSLTLLLNPLIARAEEITVSGNGDGSSNNVNISNTNTSSTEQNNNANVQNNVEVNANTGGNTANENTGGSTAITTGDVNAETTIINAGINQSYGEVGACCQGDTNIKISGNGSGSTNGVNYSNNNNTSVTVNNNANIYNSIKGYANTGYNTANKNNGSVSIDTGDITVSDTIKNQSINIAATQANAGTGGSVYITVAGNGAGSENVVAVEQESVVEVEVNNSANIVNESNWELNTGGNTASKNNGEVAIKTGDIVYTTTIENTDINTSIVDVDCCGKDNPTPPDSNPPTNPPSNGGPCTSNCGGGTGNGPSAGSSNGGPVLPVTGVDFTLLFFALVSGIMFILGWYLRLRAGRSPNFAI